MLRGTSAVIWQLPPLPDHLLFLSISGLEPTTFRFPPVPKKLSFILVNGTFGQLSVELGKCGFCLYFCCRTVIAIMFPGQRNKRRDVSLLTACEI